MKKTGFTLIELLVVITIIGILASIVLVPVTRVGNRAKDSAIKANLNTLRLAGIMYFDRTGNYTNFCTNTAEDGGAKLMVEVDKNASGGAGGADCNNSATAYAACGALNAESADWCVDSIGNAKNIPDGTCIDSWAGTVCP